MKKEVLTSVDFNNPILWPITICECGHMGVDFHTGCYGCSFCCTRSNYPYRKIFKNKIHFNKANTNDIIEIIKGTLIDDPSRPVESPLFTDGMFQWREFVDCFSHPYFKERELVFFQRSTFPKEEIDALNKFKKRLILQVTLTPKASEIGGAPFEPTEILKSLKGYNGRLIISLGPLVPGINSKEASEIIEMIPKGAKIAIRSLHFYPKFGKYLEAYYKNNFKFKKYTMKTGDVEALENKARRSGLDVFQKNHCAQYSFWKTPNPNAYKIRSKDCQTCSNRECLNNRYWGGIEDALSDIGIKPSKIIKGDRIIRVETRNPTHGFDEGYLSSRVGMHVKISNAIYTNANKSILQRWRDVSFINVDKCIDCARRGYNSVY